MLKRKFTRLEKILFLLLLVVGIVALALTKWPHLPSKLVFSFNENYEQKKLNGVDVLINKNIEADWTEIEKILIATEQHASKLFKIKKPEAVDLFLALPENRIYNLYLGKNNLGMFNSTVRTIAIDGTNKVDLYSTISHEYSHHLFHQYTKSLKLQEEIPEWIVEGLALTFEYHLTDHVLVKYGPEFVSLPFPQLEMDNGINHFTIYLQGFYAMLYLFEQYGDDILQKLLKEAANTTFHHAWAMYINEPYDTFHKNFQISPVKIREVQRLVGDDEALIAYVELLEEEHGRVNVYTPFISRVAIESYMALGETEKAKNLFDRYEPFIHNPEEFLQLANFFKADEAFRKSLTEKGIQYAKKYDYELQALEAYQ